ncbi:hypothetical protein SDC9_182273 [bioreactor metagenome]|uniref:Uncharacterized protein n=1 Tax=bioreactor metagenome TaxID=1076179 RepID=A0A645H9J8_9ZZZZ
MRDDQRGLLHTLNHLCHGIGFAAAGDAKQHLRFVPALHTFRQAVNRLRLVARGFIFGDELEFVHRISYTTVFPSTRWA